MKMISKISKIVLALTLVGSSSVFAQSLADAKKAIDAEQFQKAKSMLKNLTVTQANKDENFFYLGWVYILQEYPDSAKAVFQKGIAVNPKSALNYAGLGAAAFVDKDKATATTNFNQAVSLAGKDSKPYLYVGEAYLLNDVDGKVPAADANAAIAVLTKGKTVNPKDAEILVALGDALRTQSKNTEALGNYQAALDIDPKLAHAKVATGVIWKYANNFESSETEFKAALAIDPNYGPAYREWAETDVRWAFADPKMASAKIKEATDQYKKYLSLTDLSIESRMRYADFLLLSGDFKTLQTEAAALAGAANGNLKVYRYLAYAAYENKDYPAALTAMNTWITKADPKRIIPRDYVYLGRIQIESKQDSLGIGSLRKAIELDTTNVAVYSEIGKALYGQGKYMEAANAYNIYTQKSSKATLNDYLSKGLSYYKAFTDQYYSKATPKPIPDTTLLVKADSAFAHIQQKASAPVPIVALYQARANDFKEPDRNTSKGLAKPFYEQYIQLQTAKGVKDTDKAFMAEAYAYLGVYYEYKEKDDAKALENYSKAREFDPTNKTAAAYFSRKGGAVKGK
ncbi:tetratricopeptide repeat protein [Mucilaginibacter rigui]|uniref:Tetratricopeptide repeat protein n=1 Tax=Mucilaginibacter rigui TaxID=534635 RepID=A0ABR7X3L2_9SPHI|nr:tetratricopeptide repeat protein [Mucilaginibacter rigui]MBD1385179.1 tetratricopeptide repeat protein [Mucilaginibacter rigui]